MLSGGAADVLANIALFVPLGFLLRSAWPAVADRRGLRVLAAGAVASLGIETLQLWEPERYSSLADLFANSLGAWLGAVACGLIARRLEHGGDVVRSLSLDLPLMGLVYLVVPLLWLSGLGTAGAAPRLVLTLLLGLFGASLIASMQAHHFGPAAKLPLGSAAGLAAAWFAVGAFPALLLWPRVVLGFVVAVAAWTAWQGAAKATARPERRFELPALRRAAPWLAAYFVLSALLQDLGHDSIWGSAGEPSRLAILWTLESAAAFSVFGYLVAEALGRREQPFGRVAPWLVTGAGLVAVASELLCLAVHPPHPAHTVRYVVLAATALYGGWLYHLQRAHVQRLLALGSAAAQTRRPEPARR